MSEAIGFLTQINPFGGFCILIILIQAASYRYYAKQLRVSFDRSLEIIVSNNEKAIEALSKSSEHVLAAQLTGRRK